LFVSGDLVVSNGDALAAATILTVEPHDGMGRRAGARKEIEDNCLWLIADDKSQRVFDSKERFWKVKPLLSKDGFK
jgi:hypothetical protein